MWICRESINLSLRLLQKDALSIKLSRKLELSINICRESLYVINVAFSYEKIIRPEGRAKKIILLRFWLKKFLGPDKNSKPPPPPWISNGPCLTYCDHVLFGIRYSVVCPWSVRQFTFSTSPEPLNGFWWNLVWMKCSRSLTSCCFSARSTQGADSGWGQNSSQRVSYYSNKLNVHLYSNDLKELEKVLLFLVPFRSLVLIFSIG